MCCGWRSLSMAADKTQFCSAQGMTALLSGMSRGCRKQGVAACWPWDLGQAASPLWLLCCNTEGVPEEVRMVCPAVVSSELNKVPFSSCILPCFILFTLFHFADDFIFSLVCLPGSLMTGSFTAFRCNPRASHHGAPECVLHEWNLRAWVQILVALISVWHWASHLNLNSFPTWKIGISDSAFFIRLWGSNEKISRKHKAHWLVQSIIMIVANSYVAQRSGTDLNALHRLTMLIFTTSYYF